MSSRLRLEGATNVRLHAAACVLLGGSSLALNGSAGPVHLVHGPLISGQPRVFDLRTQSPNALALVFRTSAGAANVPSDPAWPSLGVASTAIPLALTTSSTGRARIVLPPSSVPYPGGCSFFQALVRVA